MLRQKIKSETTFNSRDIHSVFEPKIEYSMEPTSFDPSNFTPPDKFIDSLTIRMKKYYNELDEKKDMKLCIK